jgi:hypothetical protein
MWGRVDLVWTDISEELIASIFWVQKSAREEPAWTGFVFTVVQLASSLAYAANLKQRKGLTLQQK